MTERLRGRALQAMRQRVAVEQPLCPDCQAKGHVTAWYPAGQLDHIVPVSRGGSNDRRNLIGRCAECHAEKTAADFGHQRRKRVAIGIDGWPIEGGGR